mgnify:CR=1 FL=1
MRDNKPCIITVAITGSVPKKSDNSTVPITVSEQIESTRKSYDAGASLVHLHVRNKDESPSSDTSKFKELLDGIKESCPKMIVQFSTGGRGRNHEERGQTLYLKPDMASLATGSVNFPTSITNRKKCGTYWDCPIQTIRSSNSIPIPRKQATILFF